MSRNNTLQNALLISGATIDETMAADIATLNAEEEGGESRRIIPPEQLNQYLPQRTQVPHNPTQHNSGSLPGTAPPKVSLPGSGSRQGGRGGRLDESRDRVEARKSTGVNEATKIDGAMPQNPSLSVTTPTLRREPSGSFNPMRMDDFLYEVANWSPETPQPQPSEQGSHR